MRRFFTFATLVLGTVLASGLAAGLTAAPAEATPAACQQRDDVLKHLAGKYREAPVALGVTNTGGLVEVLSSGEDGTWTIIVTSPTGLSCLMAAGEGWRPLEEVLAGTPEA